MNALDIKKFDQSSDPLSVTPLKIKRIQIDKNEFTSEHFHRKIDHSTDIIFSDIKLFVGIGYLFLLFIGGFWATWNVKNILKIDLLPGPHHGSIDDINSELGM